MPRPHIHALTRPIHDRMPVILVGAQQTAWLASAAAAPIQSQGWRNSGHVGFYLARLNVATAVPPNGGAGSVQVI
jgi:hypothetical protein